MVTYSHVARPMFCDDSLPPPSKLPQPPATVSPILGAKLTIYVFVDTAYILQEGTYYKTINLATRD